MTWNPLALATALQTVPEQNIDVTNSENALIIKMNDYGDLGNDSNLLIVFYVQIMPDDFVMQLHRF
ncbi:cytoplasmic protein [Escherichia coli]|nr:cytoplasmic protein [Escherichia coli]